MVNKTRFDLLKPMPPFLPALRKRNRANNKTQTRRVMNPQPDFFDKGDGINSDWFLEWRNPRTDYLIGEWNEGEQVPAEVIDCCPYGKAGDLRYMREPLYCDHDGLARYKDDHALVMGLLTDEPIEWRWNGKTLSQLYMPKEAARTFKQYEFIRVERLNEISENDAKHEGCDSNLHFNKKLRSVEIFSRLWDVINLERGYPWDDNWWVWVIGYQHAEVSHEA